MELRGRELGLETLVGSVQGGAQIHRKPGTASHKTAHSGVKKFTVLKEYIRQLRIRVAVNVGCSLLPIYR